MEAVLLAGGFGTRLLPITRTRPKVMIPLLNKPMIDHVIDALPPEVDRVIFSVGHKYEPIKEYFDNKTDREYIFCVEDEPLGTGGGVKNCQKEINGTFLVLNTDGLNSVDISALLEFHRKRKAVGTLSLWTVDDPEPYGIVDMEEDGRINRFVEKPKREEAPSNLANAGTYVLERSALDLIPDSTLVSIEKETFPALIPHGMYGFPYDGHYLDAGNHHAFLNTQHQLLIARGRQTMLGASSVTRGSFGDNTCLGRMVELAADTHVANSTMLDYVKVEEGSTIEGSIIGENCFIGKGVRIIDSMLGDGAIIEDGAILESARVEPGETYRRQ